jgi:hypothetical protein
MSTATKADSKVTVTVSPKLVEAIRVQLDAQATMEGKILATADCATSEAKRLGYDKAQSRIMVTLSWRKALGADKLSEEDIILFDKANRPGVSKIMALAFPDEKEAVELAKVREHNRKHPAKNERVGVNRMLEVVRGNQSADDAIAHKPLVRNGTTPAAPVGATDAEKFANGIAGLRQLLTEAGKGKLTLVEARKIATVGLADKVA